MIAEKAHISLIWKTFSFQTRSQVCQQTTVRCCSYPCMCSFLCMRLLAELRNQVVVGIELLLRSRTLAQISTILNYNDSLQTLIIKIPLFSIFGCRTAHPDTERINPICVERRHTTRKSFVV
jgi:hypothetical protein